MARHLIDYGEVGFIQIDCGRIGGIGPAKQVADYAVGERRDLRQSHLHLASRAVAPRCSPMPASRTIASANSRRRRSRSRSASRRNHLERDRNGEIAAPDAPGLGIEINMRARAATCARSRSRWADVSSTQLPRLA